jgi:hypothetical protein
MRVVSAGRSRSSIARSGAAPDMAGAAHVVGNERGPEATAQKSFCSFMAAPMSPLIFSLPVM